MEDSIIINSYLPKTEVEGPGTRFCIWVQGCSIRCKGCANLHMWDISKGQTVKIKDLLKKIIEYKNQIEGITFLGGEPLDQSNAILKIAKAVQNMGLSVLLFTGYEYSNIKDNPQYQELLNNIDILIDGKYEADKQDFSRPWVGSYNQNYYFLSNRYSKNILNKYKNKIEIRILENNSIRMNGMGDFSKLKY